MDSKEIRKYIAPHSIWVAIAALLLLVALVCLVLGLGVKIKTDNASIPQWFDPLNDEKGVYGYIDVVAVSDWVLDDDGEIYYAVMSSDGYYFAVKMKSSLLKTLEEQQQYWIDYYGEEPEAIRVNGIGIEVTSDIEKAYQEVFDISHDDFVDYFGLLYLDTTTSPGEEACSMYMLMAFYLGIIGVFGMLVVYPNWNKANKAISKLENEDLLERAQMQFESESNYIIGKNRGIITRDFLIGKKRGCVIPINDIVWVYQKNQKYNFIPVDSYLMVGTVSKQVVEAVRLGKVDHEELSDAMNYLHTRNPDMMIGYTNETQKAFRDMFKKQ